MGIHRYISLGVFLLFLGYMSSWALACCDPACEGCQACEGGTCVDYDILCPGDCTDCDQGSCYNLSDMCNSANCEDCVDGWCRSRCYTPQVCVNGQCCTPSGGYCEMNGSCCSGHCNYATHECGVCENDSQCGPCEKCTGSPLQAGSCYSILPCPANTHCDNNHACVADCLENGPQCTWTDPPTSSNCTDTDPKDRTCTADDAGAVCGHHVYRWIHNWTATCVIPNCTEVTDACVELQAIWCSDHRKQEVCHCCMHADYWQPGTPVAVGTAQACPFLN